MKAMNKVYDFGDFETAVATANSGHVTVLPMEPSDFMLWQDCSSRTKRTSRLYLHEVVQVTAIRGSYDLHCKKSFSSTEEICLDFLQEKFMRNGIPSPVKATANRGVPSERKNCILKLCAIMEVDKMDFWRNLTVTQITSNSSKPETSKGNQRKKIQRPATKKSGMKKTEVKKTGEKKTGGVKKTDGVKKAKIKKNPRKAGMPKKTTAPKKAGAKKGEIEEITRKARVSKKATVPKKSYGAKVN